MFKRTDDQTLYYEFKNGHYYLLRYQGAYHRFKKVKELGRIFSGQKKEIKQAAKRHEAFKKTHADGYVKAILNDLPLVESTQKEKIQ